MQNCIVFILITKENRAEENSLINKRRMGIKINKAAFMTKVEGPSYKHNYGYYKEKLCYWNKDKKSIFSLSKVIALLHR